MAQSNSNITLTPMGSISDKLLEGLLAPLSEVLGLPCRIADPIPIPANAYDQRRGQYAGHGILVALSRQDTPGAERILGIVDADCYAPGLNFIFGQASLNGRDAFIALPRLRPSFYGQPEDETVFHERVLKEAVHELGHTYGLNHCPDPRCVMHFSNSLYDTDFKDVQFCPRCATAQTSRRFGIG
jgi:archaemetzincin